MTLFDSEPWLIGQPAVVQAAQDPPVMAADKLFSSKLRAWRLERDVDTEVVAQMLHARSGEIRDWENGVGLPDDRAPMQQAYGWMQAVVGEPHHAMVDATGRLLRYPPERQATVRDLWTQYVARQQGRTAANPTVQDRPIADAGPPPAWVQQRAHARRPSGPTRPQRPHWGRRKV